DLVAEKDVLSNRQEGHQGQFLVDDDDARAFAVGNAVEGSRLALEDHLSLEVALRMHAAQDLHERRLSGAVLANEGVDFAALDPEIDVVESLHSRKALGNAAHFQNRVHGPPSAGTAGGRRRTGAAPAAGGCRLMYLVLGVIAAADQDLF